MVAPFNKLRNKWEGWEGQCGGEFTFGHVSKVRVGRPRRAVCKRVVCGSLSSWKRLVSDGRGWIRLPSLQTFRKDCFG